MVEIIPHEKFEGVYWAILEDLSKNLATKNLAPGIQVYDEKLIQYKNEEYRIWNPYRSKLAAAILKGLRNLPIKKNTKVLYLGSATGTTVSHVSDIVGEKGIVYSLDFSSRVMREFLTKCAAYRKNVVPILADARKPKNYLSYIEEVDVIYIDVAQPEQAKILADNSDYFLKNNGEVLFIIKAMSIDVTKPSDETFKKEIEILQKRKFKILQMLHLEPYDKDHALVHALYMK